MKWTCLTVYVSAVCMCVMISIRWNTIPLNRNEIVDLLLLLLIPSQVWYHIVFATVTTWIATIHCGDVIMSAMASQITSLTSVHSSVYSGADQRKHQSSASLAFVRGIHRWPVNSPHKGPVRRQMFPFDDVIMWPNSKVIRVIHGIGAAHPRS